MEKDFDKQSQLTSAENRVLISPMSSIFDKNGICPHMQQPKFINSEDGCMCVSRRMNYNQQGNWFEWIRGLGSEHVHDAITEMRTRFIKRLTRDPRKQVVFNLLGNGQLPCFGQVLVKHSHLLQCQGLVNRRL